MAIPFGSPSTKNEYICFKTPDSSINQDTKRATWAKNEFGEALLGDPRRTDRLVKIATSRAAKPSVSLPQCFENKASLKAAYNFFDNPDKDPEAILASHYDATYERISVEPIVLAVSDTTEVDYTHHSSKKGLGYLHDLNHHGFLLHSTLVVTPENVPLGLLDQQIIYRDEQEFGKKHNRKERPIEEKESYKWIESLETTADCQKQYPCVRVVNVTDREGDIYDYFAKARQLDDQGVLVRGAWNRCVEHEEKYLWNYVESQNIVGTVFVQVPRKSGQAIRTAELSIRYGRVFLKPPKYRAKEALPLVEIDVVLAREENPPRGIEAIEWLLLTTVPVNDFEGACERVQWYTCRWIIEIYHKILKSGCKIEQRQIETAARLECYLAIDSVVAWRVLGLTMQNRETPDMPCDAFLETHEWQALVCYFQKTSTPPTQPPTLRQATLWIANLGGFLGRKGDGYPGVTVIWRGLQRLNDIAEAWWIFNHT